MNKSLVVGMAGLVAAAAFFGVTVSRAAPPEAGRQIQTERAAATNTRTATMPYEECLTIIDEVSQAMGQEPIQLVSSDDQQVVRIEASDGFVTVSCSRLDDRMVLTKSSIRQNAGFTVYR